MKIDHITSKKQARQKVIEWQQWQANQNLSYEQLLFWQGYFLAIASKFHLIKEFKENGVL